MELAKILNGEIISADSVQVYRGLDIGSAKPSAADRNEVAHHLLDILHPSQEYSAGQFYEDAQKATCEILANQRVPIVAGGTGLYLRWYMYGKPDVPKSSMGISSQVFSELMQLQDRGKWDEAVELVVNAGDLRARSVPYNNWYRLRRSLEIIRASGSPPSAFAVPYDEFQGGDVAKNLDYDFICLFLSGPRVDLYRAIDLRCEEMLMETEGLLSEASWLLDIGLHPSTNSATRAIGYRQAMEYLLSCREAKSCSAEGFIDFLSEFQKASRNFAKRQMTWFRNEKIYHWLDASRPMREVIDFVCSVYQEAGTGKVIVPQKLKMKKDVNNQRETYELKSYRPRNKLFIEDEDCHRVLDWVRRTQCQTVEVSRNPAL